MTDEQAIMEQAIAWRIRQRELGFADWDALVDWLEADPRHAKAYADLAATEEGVAEEIADQRGASPAPATGQFAPSARRSAGWRRAAAGLSVMAAAASAFFLLLPGSGGAPYVVETAAGVQRTVHLAGGSTVSLNGATRLVLDADDPRMARLEKGEAVFSVVHDADHPFRVEVDGARLVDLGTRFTVVRDAGQLEVAVSEGLVVYNPEGEAVTIPAGRKFRRLDGQAPAPLVAVDPDTVGDWTKGVLIFRDAPLAEVVADLSRATGIAMRADPVLADRRVTAVVQLDGDRKRLALDLEQLLDITVKQGNDDWIITRN